jgi:hypothetical protein
VSTTTKNQYGSPTSITCTLASLASYAGRQTAEVDNTTNDAIDEMLSGKITMGASAPTSDIHVLLYAEDTNNITDPAGSSDAARTPPGIDTLGGMKTGDIVRGTNLRYLGKIDCMARAAAATVDFMFESVAAGFKGQIPPKWGAVFVNCTGQALDSTGGNHAIYHTTLTYQNA